MNTTTDLDRAFTDPGLLLYQLDLNRPMLQFLEVSEDSYRKSTFLDRRILHAGGRTLSLPFDAVLEAMTQRHPRNTPIDFVFHSSMCCSTLLTRLLDKPGQTLTLREPLALYQSSAIHQCFIGSPVWDSRKQALPEVLFALLGKTYSPQEHVLIKPSNMANAIIDALLNTRSASKGILLHSDLESFIVSYLKKDEASRSNLPRLAASAAMLVNYQDVFPELVPGALEPLRAAAIFWHAQMLHFAGLLARHPGRLITLREDQLLAQPKATLIAVRDWLGLPLDGMHLQQVVDGPLMRSHAKDPGFQFSLEMKNDENLGIRSRYRAEIDATLVWAEPFLATKPVTVLDEHNLLDGE